MAVDQNKLKALGRLRGLGAPPTDGSPGIDEEVAPSVDAAAAAEKPPLPRFLNEQRERQGPSSPEPAAAAPQPASVAAPASAPPPAVAVAVAEGVRSFDTDAHETSDEGEEEASAPRRAGARGRGGATNAAPSRRVPRPSEEARVPFTTRIAVSTKERLEDAAYSLRMKHQDIINDAIAAHLKKLGF